MTCTEQYDPARVHQFMHCFDVAVGSEELYIQVMTDKKARTALRIPPGAAVRESSGMEAAFLAGLGHDIILGFKGDAIAQAIPEREVLRRVQKSEREKFEGKAQYIKDAIGDDLRGAIVLAGLKTHRFFPNGVPDSWEYACQELEAGSDLQVTTKTRKSLGQFSLYKILDAIWYHDGNWPIRGYAEADALIGDRVRLFKAGAVPLEVVGAGIHKLLGYTEYDPTWAERSAKADVPYLQRMIEKKAGPFLQAIAETPTYDFVVEDLSHQGRSFRTLRSPAFRAGVELMPEVLQRASRHQEIREAYGHDLDTLMLRYEQAKQLLGGST